MLKVNVKSKFSDLIIIFTGGKQSGDISQNNRHDENSGRIFVFGLFVYK